MWDKFDEALYSEPKPMHLGYIARRILLGAVVGVSAAMIQVYGCSNIGSENKEKRTKEGLIKTIEKQDETKTERTEKSN